MVKLYIYNELDDRRRLDKFAKSKSRTRFFYYTSNAVYYSSLGGAIIKNNNLVVIEIDVLCP